MAIRRTIAFQLILFILLASSARADQQQVWITNAYGDDVHVYEVSSWKAIKNFKVGLNPHGISATADGKIAHIAIENFKSDEGELVWIDTATFEVTHRLTIGPRPNENECTPDGKWIYVPCDDGQYWVIDGHEKKVVTKIKTGGRPHNTTISPDGKYMYLSPMGAPRRVTIVDIHNGHKVIGEIPFRASVRPPAIAADGKRFFQNIDGLIGFQVADIEKREVIATVEHDVAADLKEKNSRCHGLSVRPDGKEIWSCNVEHNTLHVHELESGRYKQTAKIDTPGRIYWVCFSPDSKFGFVSVRSAKQVAVVDCATKQIVKLLEAGREPKRTQVIIVPTAERAADAPKKNDPTKWASAMKKFQEQDENNPPRKGGVLFVGSSSIRMWKLAESFPDRDAINRGFGGSQIEDSIYYLDTLVLKHEPRIVVMYAGDNDLNFGKSPQTVFEDFKTFAAKVHAKLPKTKIVYIAVKPSIARWNLIDKVRAANRIIADYTKTSDLLAFVDIDTPMIGDDGKPRAEYFVKDGLHLNEKGYELWTKLVRPHLEHR